jgi:hypothetical protein
MNPARSGEVRLSLREPGGGQEGNVSHICETMSCSENIQLALSLSLCEGADYERWAPIPNFADYECSTLGRFRNVRTGRVLKGTLAKEAWRCRRQP